MPICSISGCWLPEFRGWTTSPPSRETRSADIASDCLGTQSLRIVAAIPRLGRRECKLSWYFLASVRMTVIYCRTNDEQVQAICPNAVLYRLRKQSANGAAHPALNIYDSSSQLESLEVCFNNSRRKTPLYVVPLMLLFLLQSADCSGIGRG